MITGLIGCYNECVLDFDESKLNRVEKICLNNCGARSLRTMNLFYTCVPYDDDDKMDLPKISKPFPGYYD